VKLNDFDYRLPTELIAQEPAAERDLSRLMVLDIAENTLRHRAFADFPEYLSAGDLLVVNDTKVFPARLIGKKAGTGGEVEIFLLSPSTDGTWEALSRPARRLKTGTVVEFGDGILRVEIVDKGGHGRVRVSLNADIPLEEAIDAVGKTPLPPYIRRDPSEDDRERYQTVYARERGSVAAPTAGLHFNKRVLEEITSRGISQASVTLHVGIGTFRPLSTDEAERDTLHDEYCTVPASTVDRIRECKRNGGRVFAVGTTTTRALEAAASGSGGLKPYEGWTDIFIKPPHSFKTIDCLLTNFHLPRSSLLMMVSAFAGRERILAAYEEAVSERYRFYSYGDAMLIIGKRPGNTSND